MAVSIRLVRIGKKGQPQYRVVVMDKKKSTRSSYLENLGTYDPFHKTNTLEYKKDRLEYWLKNGAEVSEGMRKLLKNAK